MRISRLTSPRTRRSSNADAADAHRVEPREVIVRHGARKPRRVHFTVDALDRRRLSGQQTGAALRRSRASPAGAPPARRRRADRCSMVGPIGIPCNSPHETKVTDADREALSSDAAPSQPCLRNCARASSMVHTSSRNGTRSRTMRSISCSMSRRSESRSATDSGTEHHAAARHALPELQAQRGSTRWASRTGPSLRRDDRPRGPPLTERVRTPKCASDKSGVESETGPASSSAATTGRASALWARARREGACAR